jgi:hypothetical protein
MHIYHQEAPSSIYLDAIEEIPLCASIGEPMDPAIQQSIVNTLQYLEQLGLDFERIEDSEEAWLILGFLKTNIGQIRVSVMLRAHERQFVAYAFHPLVVVQPIRGRTAEFIARANYGLPLGKFELDMDDGELRFSVGAMIGAEALSTEEIAELLDISIGTLAHYHTALIQTLYDGMPPEEAVRRADQ